MRIVCTGGRNFDDRIMVEELLETLNPKCIYVGDCPTGLDRFVRDFCEELRPDINIVVYHANWEKHKKAAGPIRNGIMLDEAGDDALVFAFKGGRGTADCVRQAIQRNMIVMEVK